MEKLKELIHNGVYIPTYSPIGLTIVYKGKELKLDETTEQMAIQFVKKFDTDYVRDNVFVENFLHDFCTKLGVEITKKIEDFDWSSIKNYLEEVKRKTESMTKEEKKLARELKKQIRERLKETYGFAIVDGKKVPIMNWAVEPPSIFLSKGQNPLRGRWKEAIKRKDITLNLSSVTDSPQYKGWKEIVWKPECLWIASWRDPLSGKMKYVWLHPSSFLRQERAKKKWDKALELHKDLHKIESLIEKNLNSKDLERRKLATVVFLISRIGIRVGDEKIAGEHGTVGCTTLKREHVRIVPEENLLILDFIGKDFVHWHRELKVPNQVIRNIQEFLKLSGNDFIFKGINSDKVSKFLREAIPGISAKTFRTYLAGITFEKAQSLYEKKFPGEKEFVHKFRFKLINKEVAVKLNHKKKLPKNFQERLKKKEERIKKTQEKLKELKRKLLLTNTEKKKERISNQIKKTEERLEKYKFDYEVTKEVSEWNLNTSLNSYIDPRRVVAYAKKHNIDLSLLYSKSLREKFSWAYGEDDVSCQ